MGRGRSDLLLKEMDPGSGAAKKSRGATQAGPRPEANYNRPHGDFPGGQWLTPRSHYRDHGFDPWSGN